MASPTKKDKSALLEEALSGDAVADKSPQLQPPAYEPVETTDEITVGLRKLAFGERRSTALPSNDECIAHLKLLTAFKHLRDEVSESDGLFGINDALSDKFDERKGDVLVKVREKRWAVYVTRAVDRFSQWFDVCVPSHPLGAGSQGMMTIEDVQNGNIGGHPSMQWHTNNMPPLDVLMILHSFMLNPRDFLEDCQRLCKMSIYVAGIPWAEIDGCIDNETFEYTVPPAAVAFFESKTRLAWDNLHDSPTRKMSCYRCKQDFQAPYTEGIFGTDPAAAFETAKGYADKAFEHRCSTCGFGTTHQTLRLVKFRNDLENLLKYKHPMPGTILNLKGLPPQSGRSLDMLFPNYLILSVASTGLLDMTQKDEIERRSIENVKVELETALRRNPIQRMVQLGFRPANMPRHLLSNEKVAVRRMMSRYWENSSPFALDLVGAVLRQGIFVDKMAKLDWVHSPALESTISRLISKYEIFFQIMAQNQGHMAVPTLDVDLAWHTHQLCPNRYCSYSQKMMSDELIDHNDKIDENKLSSNFAWTSKQFTKITKGGIYSECNCWYCACVRESTYSLFSTSSTAAKKNALMLHDNPNISSDPYSNPHISAHNAVRDQNKYASLIGARQKMKLDQDYKRACRRAEKAGKAPPKRDDYIYAYAWGYPMLYLGPLGYYPYAMDPCISGGMYAYNPGCYNTTAGGAGNCAMGTCSGTAGQGACAGGVGGACAGGGCGGGGGGCGGGGGGGCGGGGGGGGGGCGGGG